MEFHGLHGLDGLLPQRSVSVKRGTKMTEQNPYLAAARQYGWPLPEEESPPQWRTYQADLCRETLRLRVPGGYLFYVIAHDVVPAESSADGVPSRGAQIGRSLVFVKD
jgi:hypothetical protein